MTSVWIMFAIIILNGQPSTVWLPSHSQAECEATKNELTKEMITKYGALKGSIQCFEAKIGDTI